MDKLPCSPTLKELDDAKLNRSSGFTNLVSSFTTLLGLKLVAVMVTSSSKRENWGEMFRDTWEEFLLEYRNSEARHILLCLILIKSLVISLGASAQIKKVTSSGFELVCPLLSCTHVHRMIIRIYIFTF